MFNEITNKIAEAFGIVMAGYSEFVYAGVALAILAGIAAIVINTAAPYKGPIGPARKASRKGRRKAAAARPVALAAGVGADPYRGSKSSHLSNDLIFDPVHSYLECNVFHDAFHGTK